MKKIFIILCIFLISCDKYHTKYTISIPDKSMQFCYYYHTDSIKFNKGYIEFIPKEDSTNIYSLSYGYTIETNY